MNILKKNTLPKNEPVNCCSRSVIDRFRALAAEERFKGWPLVGEPQVGPSIPFFGQMLKYKLRTENGIEEYTSILRHFGWTVVFGVVDLSAQESPVGRRGPHVVTLCQWKPGLNQASWELPLVASAR